MKKLTILVASINAVGHVNACAGALKAMLDRGHRVVFAIEQAFTGKLAKLGYEEYVWSIATMQNGSKPESKTEIESKSKSETTGKTDENDSGPAENPGERMAKFLLDAKIIGPFTPLEKMQNMFAFWDNPVQIAEFKAFDAAIKVAISEMKPDVIFVDGSLLPSIYYSNIPWIKNISTVPLFFINDKDLPPGGSGLPSDDRTDWHTFDEIRKEFETSEKMATLFAEMGYEPYPDNKVMPETESLTVYAYPEELNFEKIRQKGYFNLEVFNKEPVEETAKLADHIPGSFVDDDLGGKWSGKWIYVSMGSMGSVDLDLMSRLLSALAETPHKYIVSKGPRHSEIDLPANMYGDRYLPQTKIIPLVDAVITHGGNNTTTEVFAVGRPMIVLPLFADQFDNAQRLRETDLGVRLEPYEFTAKQLHEAVRRVLTDRDLRDRCRRASDRIARSDRIVELAIRIESMFGKD